VSCGRVMCVSFRVCSHYRDRQRLPAWQTPMAEKLGGEAGGVS
jgi:hypothetical protein